MPLFFLFKEVLIIQIQLSTHSFRIFYGDNFGDLLVAVINTVNEYEKDISIRWYDDFCVIQFLEKVGREEWADILEMLFDEIIE